MLAVLDRPTEEHYGLDLGKRAGLLHGHRYPLAGASSSSAGSRLHARGGGRSLRRGPSPRVLYRLTGEGERAAPELARRAFAADDTALRSGARRRGPRPSGLRACRATGPARQHRLGSTRRDSRRPTPMRRECTPASAGAAATPTSPTASRSRPSSPAGAVRGRRDRRPAARRPGRRARPRRGEPHRRERRRRPRCRRPRDRRRITPARPDHVLLRAPRDDVVVQRQVLTIKLADRLHNARTWRFVKAGVARVSDRDGECVRTGRRASSGSPRHAGSCSTARRPNWSMAAPSRPACSPGPSACCRRRSAAAISSNGPATSHNSRPNGSVSPSRPAWCTPRWSSVGTRAPPAFTL